MPAMSAISSPARGGRRRFALFAAVAFVAVAVYEAVAGACVTGQAGLSVTLWSGPITTAVGVGAGAIVMREAYACRCRLPG